MEEEWEVFQDGDARILAVRSMGIELHQLRGTGRALYAPLQENVIVGVHGAATCVGVVIVTPTGNVAVYHFAARANPVHEISQYKWPAGSQAVIAGGAYASNSRRTYDWLIQALGGAKITLVGVADYNEVYWGNLGEGKVGWYLPQVPGAASETR